jgi:hypothetical protein
LAVGNMLISQDESFASFMTDDVFLFPFRRFFRFFVGVSSSTTLSSDEDDDVDGGE